MQYVKLPSNSLERKESRAWPAILSAAPRGPIWMSANYQAFAVEGFMQNPTVFSCINATVMALRGIEWGVYTIEGTEKVWLDEGPLNDLILRPNPEETWADIVGKWSLWMEISGNAYIEGVSLDKDSPRIKRPPQELYILRSDRMFIVPGTPQIPIASMEYRAGAQIVPYVPQLWRDPRTGVGRPRLPVCHSKYPHPQDDFYGFSPIQAAARHIDSTASALTWNVALMQNSARPSGIFSTNLEMGSVQQFEEWTDAIRQKYSGPGNAGRPMVLGTESKWQPIGLTPAEMDWFKSIEHDTTAICRVFGIPPEIIGDTASRTYSNYEQAVRSVYNETWLPRCDILASDLNVWLSPLFREAYGRDVYIGYRKDRIEAVQQDQQVVRDSAVKLYDSGMITMAAAQKMVGLEPDPNGEVYKIPTTSILVPAKSLGKTANALAQQTINPPKPQPALPPGKPAKKGDPELEMLFGETIGKLKLLG